MSNQLDSFEARLLTELRQHVLESQSVDTVPEKRARRSKGPRLVVASAAAILLIVAVLLAPGPGSSPAYSVAEGNAGEIRVEINRPEDADGLEQALEESGIAADITYLPQLQVCEPGRYSVVDRPGTAMISVAERSISVSLPPGTIREGETFVLAWSVVPLEADDTRLPVGVVDGFRTTVEFDIATGPVAPCNPINRQQD